MARAASDGMLMRRFGHQDLVTNESALIESPGAVWATSHTSHKRTYPHAGCCRRAVAALSRFRPSRVSPVSGPRAVTESSHTGWRATTRPVGCAWRTRKTTAGIAAGIASGCITAITTSLPSAASGEPLFLTSDRWRQPNSGCARPAWQWQAGCDKAATGGYPLSPFTPQTAGDSRSSAADTVHRCSVPAGRPPETRRPMARWRSFPARSRPSARTTASFGTKSQRLTSRCDVGGIPSPLRSSQILAGSDGMERSAGLAGTARYLSAVALGDPCIARERSSDGVTACVRYGTRAGDPRDRSQCFLPRLELFARRPARTADRRAQGDERRCLPPGAPTPCGYSRWRPGELCHVSPRRPSLLITGTTRAWRDPGAGDFSVSRNGATERWRHRCAR